MQPDIKTMTVEQLKSIAYDQVMLLNQIQVNINALQKEIESRKTETKEQNGTTTK